MKHRAEDIVDAARGVKDVDNRIRNRTREPAGFRRLHFAAIFPFVSSAPYVENEAHHVKSIAS